MAKLSMKRAETVALWAVVAHLTLGALTFLLGMWNQSVATDLVAWQLLTGAPVWFLCLIHLRQKRLAEEERTDWEHLMSERQAQGGKGALFEVEEGEGFIMRNRLRSLERFWQPALSLTLVAAFGLLCFFVFKDVLLGMSPKAIGETLDHDATLLTACLLIPEFFVTFLIGMFAAGMAREREWRDMRSGASYMMFSAGCLALTTIALLVAQWDFYWVELAVAYLIGGMFGVLGFEILFNFVMNIYRPRVAGAEIRFAYDSRLLELLTSPGSVLQTAAATLDYQFGFKVSETWFYRFMERMIAPIILFQLATLYALSCLVIVGAGEKTVIEHFGQPKNESGLRLLEPGIHLKWPWPIDKAYALPVRKVQSITLGHAAEPEFLETPDQFLWTVSHYDEEYNLLVATKELAQDGAEQGAPLPVNLLSTTVTVQYRIKDEPEAIYNYMYGLRDPRAVLESLAYRELTRYMATVDYMGALCEDRYDMGDKLKAKIADVAEREKLGVEILFVGFRTIHPPIEAGLGEAFEQVVASRIRKQADILEAEGYEIERETMVEHEARSHLLEASAYKEKRSLLARADAVRFKEQLRLNALAPDVFKLRLFLDALEDTISDIRKYVIVAEHWNHEVVSVDLTESRSPSLLDVTDIGDEEQPAGPRTEGR